MASLQGWEIALFDAGNTLVRQHPGLAETILAYSEGAALGLTPESAALAARAALAWADAQSLLEDAGAPRLEHQSFLRHFYAAALSKVLPEWAEGPVTEAAEKLYAYSHVARHWAASPGASDLLALLGSRGRRAGLVSNFAASLRGILESEGLLGSLDPVVISAEVGIEKPDPRILMIACERASVAPERAVYIGDHPMDVLCARRAGMPVIWVAPFERRMPPELRVEPDFRAERLEELPKLLGLG